MAAVTWVCQRVWGRAVVVRLRVVLFARGRGLGPVSGHGASEGGGWATRGFRRVGLGLRVQPRAWGQRGEGVSGAGGGGEALGWCLCGAQGLGPASGRGASEPGLGSTGALQGWEVLEELGGDDADFVDGLLEGFLGSGGGVLDSGDFSDELSGGLFDLVGCGVDSGWLAESFN